MNPIDKKLEILRISNEESNRITRESIQTALIYLMNKRDIQDITVTELVNKAGVSRAAFYRNYNNTRDVLFDFSKNVLELFAASLSNIDYAHNIYEWYRFLFKQLKNNAKVMGLLLKANIDFSGYLVSSFECNDTLDEYRLLALGEGVFGIIKRWFNTGMRETPNEMAKLCQELFPQTELIFNSNNNY
jgi:AcrR family transcriptional regulator